jgi:excisionase family DNA binding protein
MPALLTTPEAAAQLGVSRRTIEREIEAGVLAYVNVRGAKRITPDDLAEYIARNRRYTPAPCQSANVVTFGTRASRSAGDALNALLARAGRTPSRSKRGSATSRSKHPAPATA